MPYISLLGEYSDHGPTVADSGQYFIFIKGIPINIEGGQVGTHVAIPPHDPTLTNNMQSYITINKQPIFLIGDSATCGAELIPDPEKKKPLQEFISIS